MLRGVLFDLGDTLQEFHVEDWTGVMDHLNRGLYEHLAGTGHSDRLPPLDEFLELMHTSVEARRIATAQTMQGGPVTEALDEVLKQRGIEDLRAEECLVPWYSRITDLIVCPPDVRPTLQYLHDGGLKLGLVSNTMWPSGAHDRDLERFGIKDLLECRLYSCEVGWEKPAPQIFEAALECVGLAPEEVAFVGDFLRYDVAGAHNMGMKAVWRKVEGRPDSVDDHSIVPDATIAHIGELPAALEKLYGWRP